MTQVSNASNIDAWSGFSPESFGDEGDAARRYILNPVLFGLFGDLAGRSLLDAGCGTGYLSRLCAQRGALVTGVEPAATLFAYCRERERADPLGIRYIQADLSHFTSGTDRHDCVVANMVFMDIPEYQAAMRNSIEALKPGGQFIFSLLHPCFDELPRAGTPSGYLAKGYLHIEEYLSEFVVPQMTGFYVHRPLSAYLNLVIDEGCVVRRIVEPTLTPEGVRVLGEHHRELRVPSFVVVSATKGS